MLPCGDARPVMNVIVSAGPWGHLPPERDGTGTWEGGDHLRERAMVGSMSPAQVTVSKTRRPVLRFWVVATTAEVVLAVLLLLTGGDAAIESALAATGTEFNTDLVTALLLGVAYPAAALGIVLSIAQVAAPDLAILVVTRGVRSGPGSLSAVMARFRFWSKDLTPARGLLIWTQMLVLFVVLDLATAGLDHWWLGPQEYQWHAPRFTIGLLGALAVAMFLDAGALFEENGWRGYALPQLVTRHSPIRASVVLGLGWAAWHYPVKYNAITDYGIGGLAYLAAFTLKIVLLTIVMTYFWQRAGQATIIAIAMHGLSNDSLRLQGELIGDSLHLSILSELAIAVPLAIAATVLAAATRGRLGAARGQGPT